MASVEYGRLPFREQIEFFRRKLKLPSSGWTDIYTHEHDWAFVVAGANRDALLEDFHKAVSRAIEDGATLADFRKDFDSIVKRHGWDYNGGRNWRSRIIYETNLRTSYAAGRWQQLQRLKSVRPYWQYVHSDAVQHPRPLHQSWDGLVLHADDPWWHTHFPPNGWGCQCTVHALNERDLQRLGKTGPDTAPEIRWETKVIGKRSPLGPRVVQTPEGIDPGFAYAPGRARMLNAMPPERPQPTITGTAGGHGLPNRRSGLPLPAPRILPASLKLAEKLPDEEYMNAFLEAFGASIDEPAIFTDVIGERIVIGARLFEDRDKGGYKANKFGRGPYLPYIAEGLKSPDEIWVRMEWNPYTERLQVRRRYIAQFEIPGEKKKPAMLVVFERGEDGWFGITAYRDARGNYDPWRVGVRLYRRPESDGE